MFKPLKLHTVLENPLMSTIKIYLNNGYEFSHATASAYKLVKNKSYSDPYRCINKGGDYGPAAHVLKYKWVVTKKRPTISLKGILCK